MHASLYLVGFAAASIVAGGLFEIGCSSSSSSAPATTPDAATDASDDGGDDADAAPIPCTPVTDSGVRADTLDGGSSWSCFQAACNASAFTACSNECACNNALLTGLNCIATDAGTATQCFTNAVEGLPVGDTNFAPLATCLMANAKGCAGIILDSGLDGATTPDASDSGPAPVVDAGDAGVDAQ